MRILPPTLVNLVRCCSGIQRLYAYGDTGSFVQALKGQLERRELLELQVPTWRVQALMLEEHMQTVLAGA